PTSDVTAQLPRLIQFVKQQGIKLDYSDRIAPARGISYGGAIRLLPNMAPAEEFATLVHEVAHEMIHKAERRNFITKTVRETEAEKRNRVQRFSSPTACETTNAIGLSFRSLGGKMNMKMLFWVGLVVLVLGIAS